MTATIHERLTSNAETADRLDAVRLGLGAVCVPLPDTKSSLSVLQIKKELERRGISATMTMHRVSPPGQDTPSYSGRDEMAAIFTPASDIATENAIREQALEEAGQTIYPEQRISNWSEIYGPDVFHEGSSAVIIPEDTPPAPEAHVGYIAHLLTEQSAVIAA